MESVIRKIEAKFKKPQVVDVMPGDTVKVHQKIKEGSKERVQIFQGMVIRVDRKGSLSSRIVVRRTTGGFGVEKSFLLHSPLLLKVEVIKRSKVRRNNLTYMRERTGKSARLANVAFDQESVNAIQDVKADQEEAKLAEETAKAAKADADKKDQADAELEAKADAVQASHSEEKTS